MSVLTPIKGRNFFLSLLEVILFFSAVSAAYGLLVPFFYLFIVWVFGLGGPDSFSQVISVQDWPQLLPAWLYAAGIAGYALLLTVYWSPGEEAEDTVELRAFVVFLAMVLIAAGVVVQVKWHALSRLYEWLKG